MGVKPQKPRKPKKKPAVQQPNKTRQHFSSEFDAATTVEQAEYLSKLLRWFVGSVSISLIILIGVALISPVL